jgi:hypothetical protein
MQCAALTGVTSEGESTHVAQLARNVAPTSRVADSQNTLHRQGTAQRTAQPGGKQVHLLGVKGVLLLIASCVTVPEVGPTLILGLVGRGCKRPDKPAERPCSHRRVRMACAVCIVLFPFCANARGVQASFL